MRSCDEIVDLISGALDGTLTSDEQTALDEHLAACPACSALFADLHALHITSAELEDVSAPAGFAAQVMAGIAANPAQERPDNVIPFPAKTVSRTPWKKWAASAAVVAVVALGAVALPGQLGGSMMKSTADMAAPAAAPEFAEPAEAPVEVMMDMVASASIYAAEGESDNGSTQNFSLESATEDAALPESAPENQKTSANTTSATNIPVVCGVLVLTEEDLPDGLDEFELVQEEDGTLIYTIPADFFSTCKEATKGKASSDYSAGADLVISPSAPYGLIVVEAPSNSN